MTVCHVIVLPTCAICQDEDEGVSNVVVTKCGHIFHSHCLEEWCRQELAIRAGSKCPYCNTSLGPQSYYFPHQTTTTVRVHQLTQRRVSILSEEDPCPEEQLKNLQSQISSVKLDLDKQSIMVHDQERRNAQLAALNIELQRCIDRLSEESQSYCDQADAHATQLQKEKETHQGECIVYSKEEERLRNIAGGLEEGRQRVKSEVARLSALLERKKIEKLRISGIVASQSGTIRISQAQVANLTREKDQLEQMIDMTRGSQKMSSDGKSIGSDRSHHLTNLMVALSGRFSKIESECSSIKQMLGTKEDQNERLEMTADESVKHDPDPDQALDRMLRNGKSVPILEPVLEPIIDRAQGKQKIEGLAPQISALVVSPDGPNENMDPRLFA